MPGAGGKIGRRRIDVSKVVAAEFVSLDGVMETSERWHLPYINEEFGQAVGEGLAASDALLMGRVNYEEWAASFPQQDPEENPMAARMNDIKKYVVSTTLTEPLEWNNSTLIKENVAEEISALKRQPGKNISISGSGTLVRSLLADGLLDELTLMVFPVVVGRGKRLFEDGGDRKGLKLVDSRTFATGVVFLVYRPADEG
jgi:dihydrofolate reductase